MAVAGRRYAVVFNNVAATATQDLLSVKPAADKICIIEAVYLAASGGASDAGDAQEELYEIRMIRWPATVTLGTSGSSFTPNPLVTSDTAAGFTARVNDTGLTTTSGTALNLHCDGWNNRSPYVWCPPEEHRHVVANAQAWTCRLATAPADSILLNGTAIVCELG